MAQKQHRGDGSDERRVPGREGSVVGHGHLHVPEPRHVLGIVPQRHIRPGPARQGLDDPVDQQVSGGDRKKRGKADLPGPRDQAQDLANCSDAKTRNRTLKLIL